MEKVLEGCDHGVGVEAGLLGEEVGLGGECVSQVWLLVKVDDGLGKLLRLVDGGEQSVAAMIDEAAWTRSIGGDDGQAGGHGFKQG